MAEKKNVKMMVDRTFSCSPYKAMVTKGDVIKVATSYFNQLPNQLGHIVDDKTKTNIKKPQDLVKRAMTMTKNMAAAKDKRAVIAMEKMLGQAKEKAGASEKKKPAK